MSSKKEIFQIRSPNIVFQQVHVQSVLQDQVSCADFANRNTIMLESYFWMKNCIYCSMWVDPGEIWVYYFRVTKVSFYLAFDYLRYVIERSF